LFLIHERIIRHVSGSMAIERVRVLPTPNLEKMFDAPVEVVRALEKTVDEDTNMAMDQSVVIIVEIKAKATVTLPKVKVKVKVKLEAKVAAKVKVKAKTNLKASPNRFNQKVLCVSPNIVRMQSMIPKKVPRIKKKREKKSQQTWHWRNQFDKCQQR